MSRSKGDRVRFTCRLPTETYARLDAYRIQHNLDGLPSVIEEWSSLRSDRDAELEAARAAVRRAIVERDAAISIANEKAREVKHYRKLAGKRDARRKSLQRVPQQGLPESVILAAESTQCKSCEFFMDPMGHFLGESSCASCRAAKVASIA